MCCTVKLKRQQTLKNSDSQTLAGIINNRDPVKTPMLNPNQSYLFIEVKLESLHFQQIPGESNAMDQGTTLREHCNFIKSFILVQT